MAPASERTAIASEGNLYKIASRRCCDSQTSVITMPLARALYA